MLHKKTYWSENYLNILYNYGILNVIQISTRTEWYDNILTSNCIDHVNVRMNGNVSYTAFVIEEN